MGEADKTVLQEANEAAEQARAAVEKLLAPYVGSVITAEAFRHITIFEQARVRVEYIAQTIPKKPEEQPVSATDPTTALGYQPEPTSG